MKRGLKLAFGVLAFSTVALAAFPAGRAFALNERTVCDSALRTECIDVAAQDAKCCLDPTAAACAKTKLFVEARPAQETPEQCILQGLRDFVDCKDCEFPAEYGVAPASK